MIGVPGFCRGGAENAEKISRKGRKAVKWESL
jgi:hypothetical protein